MKRMLSLALCASVLFYAFAAPEEQPPQPPEWVEAASMELSNAIQLSVTYLQSGPQNVFYVETLPVSVEAEAAIIQVLNTYRSNVVTGGAVVMLGLDPEIAYFATPTNEAQRMANSTMVGYYATIADGQKRFGSAQGLGELTSGCVSSSNANSSTLQCNFGGQSTSSRCDWNGKSLVCRSTND